MRDAYFVCVICKAIISFFLDPYSQEGEKQFHLQIVDFKVYSLKNLIETVVQILCMVSLARGLPGSFLIVLVPLRILRLILTIKILTEGSL